MEEQTWWATEAAGEETEPSMTDQQATVNTYVTMMLQLIQLHPRMPAPQVLEMLVNPAPLLSAEQILAAFGGWSVFCRAKSRMEELRGGTVNGELMNLPLTTQIPEGEPFGYTIPGWDGSIAWWAPQTAEGAPPFLFSIRAADRGYLQRYPHMGAYTEDYEEVDKTDSEEGEDDAP